MDKSNITEAGLGGLHPYLVDSWEACQEVAPQIVNDIDNGMLDDRPDSLYMVVTTTNIRIYCFLVDLPVGNTPCAAIYKRQTYIEDVEPTNVNDNLCLFRCLVKKFRPLENQEEREIRVQLMWRIFQAAKYKEVKSDSVIKDHRQVYLQNDLDYLINEIVDYTDLLNQNLPATNQWAEPEIQQAIHNMSGVMLDELSKVEELFDLHIDVFDLKEVEKKGKTQKTAANVVRLSERPSDRAVDLLLETENGGRHYYMVTDTKNYSKN